MGNTMKPRIVVFSPFYPPHIGGLESHAREFNEYLSQKGVKITVLTPQIPQNAPDWEISGNNIEILRFPAFEPIANYPLPRFWKKAFWEKWQTILRKDADIVLSRTRFFFTSLMAWHFSRKKLLPWVHIEHGSDYARFDGTLKTLAGKAYDHLFGRFVLRNSNWNIANSAASAKFVRMLSGRDKCDIIYRGVETETILGAPEKKSLREHYANIPIIAYVGRLIDGKGVGNLIQALASLKGTKYHCLIVGDGPQRRRLEKQVSRLRLSSTVQFFGHQPFLEAIGIMKTADIFVNPSYTEGIPTAVIDAALCRKAIVATNVGGTKEIISGKGDGFLIQPGNAGLIREKLQYLLDHPDVRKQCGENAFHRVRERFDWNVSREKYLELFEKIISDKSSRH